MAVRQLKEKSLRDETRLTGTPGTVQFGGERSRCGSPEREAIVPLKVPDSLIAVAETLAALAACIAASFLIGGVLSFLTVLLSSPEYRAEYELTPRDGRQEEAAPFDEVVHDVEGLGLAPVVSTREVDETTRLVLDGLESAEFEQERLFAVIVAAGYQVGDLTVRRSITPARLLKMIAAPYLTLQAAVFLICGGFLSWLRSPTRMWERRAGHAAAILLGAGAGVAAFAASLMIGALLHVLGIPVREQDWIVELLSDRGTVLLLAPWIVLIVPISEEVFFRGYVFRFLTQKSGPILGFLFSSLTFAAVHFNLSGLPVYFAIGMVLAFVYFRTGSLLAPIAGHVVHNTIVLIGAIYLPLGQ